VGKMTDESTSPLLDLCCTTPCLMNAPYLTFFNHLPASLNVTIIKTLIDKYCDNISASSSL
jgi:hypothetical protein